MRGLLILQPRVCAPSAAAVLVTIALAGCGSSSSTATQIPAGNQSTTTQTTAQTTIRAKPAPKPDSCISGGSYGGIGASVAAFKRTNNTLQPSSYQPGLAYWQIMKTKRGCVTEYTITESTIPTQSSRDLLSLVAGINLPNDANTLVNGNSCESWESKALKKAVGLPYAVGYVTVPPEGTATGIVDMSASASPSC
jgi:hypothetical protein